MSPNTKRAAKIGGQPPQSGIAGVGPYVSMTRLSWEAPARLLLVLGVEW